jgi:uracil-DNA glycosylase
MQKTLIPNNIHSSWQDFLNNDRIHMLNDISHEIGTDVNPDVSKILRFLNVDLSSVKVVILGQDPYPERGMATGRAFEVGGLVSWEQPFRQVSLKNIVRLLHKNYNNISNYNDIFLFTHIKQEIKEGSFPILPPNKLLSSWEQQGVLLLNTSLSCRPNKPKSHAHIWKDFSYQLIEYISKNSELYWFLWGKHAQSMKPIIKNGNFIMSRHPMLCSSKYDDDFLKSDCFIKTNHIIKWLGTD